MCLTGGAISGPWRTIQRNNDASHRAICLQIRNITSYNHQQTTVVAGGRCCEVGGLLVSNAWWEEDNDGNDLITSWVVLDHDGDHGPVLSEWRLHPSSEHVNTVSWWHLNMSTLSADDIWTCQHCQLMTSGTAAEKLCLQINQCFLILKITRSLWYPGGKNMFC